MNKFIGIGNMVADPEIRTTDSGGHICKFRIAIARKFKRAGEDKPETDFFTCTAFNEKGVFVSKYFTKGKAIALEGTVQNRSWEAEDGTKRYATDIIVDSVEFVGSKGDSAPQAKPAARPKPSAPDLDDSDLNSELPF